jgi:hypothetical protein
VGTPESQDEDISRPSESEKKGERLVKQSKEVSIDIPIHSDLFNKMDETSISTQSKFHDTPVHLDRQKE